MTATKIRTMKMVDGGDGYGPRGPTIHKKALLLGHPVRSRIYDRISEEPGIHFTAIMNALGLKNGVVSHHISKLKRGGLIISRRDGVFTRYFLIGWSSLIPKHLQERIFDIVLFRPGITQSQIGRLIDRTRQVVNYNIRKMVSKGSIKVIRQGRCVNCYVRDLVI